MTLATVLCIFVFAPLKWFFRLFSITNDPAMLTKKADITSPFLLGSHSDPEICMAMETA